MDTVEKKPNIALDLAISIAVRIKELFDKTKADKKGDAFYQNVLGQISRSSSSIAANIAESNGGGHASYKFRAKALKISLGEAEETKCWVMLFTRYYPNLESEMITEIINDLDSVILILNKSLTTITKKINTHCQS